MCYDWQMLFKLCSQIDCPLRFTQAPACDLSSVANAWIDDGSCIRNLPMLGRTAKSCLVTQKYWRWVQGIFLWFSGHYCLYIGDETPPTTTVH